MRKKLMAVAVAGALAVPAMAFAQASNVQIYGRAHLGIDQYQAKGATGGSAFDLKNRTRVYDYTSRIGFRGVENLGGGLRALFLMESGVNIDTGNNLNQQGLPNTSTGFLSSRIGHVGLSGNWGQLTFGRSNVWWGNGRNDQAVSSYLSGNTVGVFSGTFGRGMSVAITRTSSTVQYTSPTFSGFNAVLSYSPQRQEAQGVNLNADGRVMGVTVAGQYGQFIGGYDWAKDEGNTPVAGNQGSNTGNKLRAGWQYQPGAQVSLLYIVTKLQNGGAAGGGGVDPTSNSVSQKAWGLSWEHVFGNIQGIAQFAKIRDATGCTVSATCANTNATEYTVAARYLFSKRTAAYLSYGTIRNASNYNAEYTTYTAGLLPAVGSRGADPRVWALGLMHNF
ncbi:MAG: porin [Betaproteobacteria bacterium]|nr:porin [Betaproteobacteria bacterium]